MFALPQAINAKPSGRPTKRSSSNSLNGNSRSNSNHQRKNTNNSKNKNKNSNTDDPKNGSSNQSRNRQRMVRRQPSSFANDESRKAIFGRGDNVSGQDVLNYLEEHLETQELYCRDALSKGDLIGLHQLFVKHHHWIHLHSLEVPKNKFSAETGKDLANIIQSQQQTLSKLDLSENPLTAVGLSSLLEPLMVEFSPSHLKVLKLNDTQLGSKGANQVASILRHNVSLEELYIANNHIGTKGMKVISSALASNTTLQVLDISYNMIKKQGATLLADTLINSPTIKLRIVDVTANNLGPAGIQAFAHLLAVDRRLEGFYACRNDIQTEGAIFLHNALKVNYTLKDLRLAGNAIGDAGASLLSDSLMENDHRSSSLERLNLSWNDIGFEGATGIGELLKDSTTLKHIDLTGNRICSRAAEFLADSLTYNLSLQTLLLDSNNIQDEGAFAFAFAMGKPTCSVETLTCDHNPITIEGQASIARVPQLRRNQKYWLGQALRDLSKGCLNSIHLVGEQNIADEELLLLTEVLESASPLVRRLCISGRTLTTRSLLPFCARALNGKSKIQRLYLKGISCGNDVAKALSRVLPSNTSLEVLSFADSSLTPIGALAIATGLSGNSTLRRLNLDRNCIGDVGMNYLGDIIGTTSLRSLSVSRNSITDQSMDFEHINSLEELHLNGNPITDIGALKLCRFLVDNDTLHWLRLSETQITSRGRDAIKSFLPNSTNIEC